MFLHQLGENLVLALRLLLEGSAGADGALAQDARLIRAEIDRCRAILDQMAGRIEPAGDAPRSMPCADVIAAATAPLSPLDRQRVSAAGAADLRVVWPVGAVSQALRNLVRNALQATATGANVRIEVTAVDRDRVRLRVIDDGTGMTDEDLARAGEPFFTTKPPGSGMGLGLFVARSTVEQLGGALTLARRPEGGLVADIVLPRDVVAPGAPR